MSRARILAAARAVFAAKGFEEASVREIARAAGLKAPSIYAHFESKQGIFESVYAAVTVEHNAFFAQLAADSAQLPPLERIRHLLLGVDSFYAERQELADFSLRAAVSEQGSQMPNLRQVFLDHESTLTTAFRDAYLHGVKDGSIGAPAEDVDAFIALALLLMDGLFLQRAHYTTERFDERFQLTWRHLAERLASRKDARAVH